MIAGAAKLRTEVLPDHEREAKEENIFALMFFQKSPEAFRIQLHVFIQRVDLVAPEHAEAQNASTAR